MEDQAEYKTKQMTLSETYFHFLEEANKKKLTQFFFEYKDTFYQCIWENQKWSDLKEISRLNFPSTEQTHGNKENNSESLPNYPIEQFNEWVKNELKRAISLHGDNPKEPHAMMSVLIEEVGEVAKALNDNDLNEALTELVQVATVAYRLYNILYKMNQKS